jgi:hypothetical protein
MSFKLGDKVVVHHQDAYGETGVIGGVHDDTETFIILLDKPRNGINMHFSGDAKWLTHYQNGVEIMVGIL